jgi:hypothetical protein
VLTSCMTSNLTNSCSREAKVLAFQTWLSSPLVQPLPPLFPSPLAPPSISAPPPTYPSVLTSCMTSNLTKSCKREAKVLSGKVLAFQIWGSFPCSSNPSLIQRCWNSKLRKDFEEGDQGGRGGGRGGGIA